MAAGDALSPRRSPRQRRPSARAAEATATSAVAAPAGAPAQAAPSARAGGAGGAPALRPQLRLGQPGCLCHISQVPLHLRFNVFVHRGYRCGLSTRGCVRSVAQWHNETLNVWTHALAAAISAVALLTPWAPPGAPALHTALRCAAAVPMIVSFCLSVTYHTFMAHKRCSSARGGAAAYERLLCADVAGVVGVLSVPQVPIVWYGFHTAPRLRNALLGVMAAGAACGTRATCAEDQTARAWPLAALVVARLVALCMRLGGYGAPCAAATRGYFWMELIIGAGGAANALFLPERFFPGRLDYAINSHQIMHLCTTFGAAAVYWALREDYRCYAAATGAP